MKITNYFLNAIELEICSLIKFKEIETNLAHLESIDRGIEDLKEKLREFKKHVDKEIMIYNCETTIVKSNPPPPLDIEKAIAYKIYGQALENIPIGAMVMMNPENGHTFTYREKA